MWCRAPCPSPLVSSPRKTHFSEEEADSDKADVPARSLRFGCTQRPVAALSSALGTLDRLALLLRLPSPHSCPTLQRGCFLAFPSLPSRCHSFGSSDPPGHSYLASVLRPPGPPLALSRREEVPRDAGVLPRYPAKRWLLHLLFCTCPLHAV